MNSIEIDTWGALPHKAHTEDAAYDLRSAVDEQVPAGGRALIPTGTHVDFPPGTVGLVCSRSGLALKHGIQVLNAPGVIDPTYTGDVGVILYNTSDKLFDVSEGDRIAQLLILATPHVTFRVTHPRGGFRGGNGFGSSGTK